MSLPADARGLCLWLPGALCAACLTVAGCGDARSDVAHSQERAVSRPAAPAVVATDSAAGSPVSAASADSQSDEPASDATAIAANPATEIVSSETENNATQPAASTANSAAKERAFAVEGPGEALRIGFDDLDLLKILRMDPVTADCDRKMPAWLRNLAGKPVRIRGYMKPGLLLSGIPQFLLVRDTGLCCFGPKGKIYDMIAVTLKPGTTTDYIELRPFDVAGTFRIEPLTLDDDGTLFGLYYIDDAQIIQR